MVLADLRAAVKGCAAFTEEDDATFLSPRALAVEPAGDDSFGYAMTLSVNSDVAGTFKTSYACEVVRVGATVVFVQRTDVVGAHEPLSGALVRAQVEELEAAARG